MTRQLYTYYRSSAAYRVRIALNLKGLQYDSIPIHLRDGEHSRATYLEVNPQGLVPALVDEGFCLTQSLAILEYLEETHPEPALLPRSAQARARVRQLALIVACDIHPLNNLSVLTRLKAMGVGEDARNEWYCAHVQRGLQAMEVLVAGAPETGTFCHGDHPSFADICLVPQLYNARRFNCDMSACPTLLEIDRRCLELTAFADAAPENQADAE